MVAVALGLEVVLAEQDHRRPPQLGPDAVRGREDVPGVDEAAPAAVVELPAEEAARHAVAEERGERELPQLGLAVHPRPADNVRVQLKEGRILWSIS